MAEPTYRVQILRGTTAANDIYTGPEGEFTIDFEKWQIRLHDGVTPGGHLVGNHNDIQRVVEENDLVYLKIAYCIVLYSGTINDLNDYGTNGDQAFDSNTGAFYEHNGTQWTPLSNFYTGKPLLVHTSRTLTLFLGSVMDIENRQVHHVNRDRTEINDLTIGTGSVYRTEKPESIESSLTHLERTQTLQRNPAVNGLKHGIGDGVPDASVAIQNTINFARDDAESNNHRSVIDVIVDEGDYRL